MRLFSICAAMGGGLFVAGACIPDAVLISGSGGAGAGTSTGTGSGSGVGTGTGSGSGSGAGTGSGTATGTGQVGCDMASDCPGMDTTCQMRVCTDGTCDFDLTAEATPCTENGGQLCDGMGTCVECLVDGHCTEPPCINNECGVKLDNGEPCVDGGDCTSDNCVDGFCCDVACGGACESCAAADTCGTDGTCAPVVAGTDPAGDCNANQACFAGACGAGKLAFVTSALYDGALGGLSGADQLCMNHAALGCLPGTYMAWLSTATESPSTRFTQDNVPYRRVDGTIIANSYADLTDGALTTPLNLDEVGNAGPTANIMGCDPDLSWSGTDIDGTPLTTTPTVPNVGPQNRCQEWTVTTADGLWGRFGAQTGNWTDYCSGNGGGSCQLATALYCFQQ